MSRLKPNDIFAQDYRLIEPLGKGGFSQVWKAEYLTGKIVVALKIYAPHGGLDSDGLHIFQEEYRKVYNLNHGNLLRATHFAVHNDSPYLVLPFCAGGTAQQKIGKMSEIELAKLLYEVASGLEYLHKENIVHQDLKPNNFLFNEKGAAMLSDFGISSQLRETLTHHATESYDSMMTLEYEFNGSTPPAYRAPELSDAKLAGREPSFAQDVFSLGVSIFQIATGKLPFNDLGGTMLLNGGKIPDLPSNFSKGFQNLLHRMMAKKASDRPTASEICDETHHFLGNQGWAKPSIWEKWQGLPLLAKSAVGLGLAVLVLLLANPFASKPSSSSDPKPNPSNSEADIAIFKENEKFGFKNTRTGKIIAPAIYLAVTAFSEGRGAVMDWRGLWGFLDTDGREVIPCIYGNAQAFRDGKSLVRKDTQCFNIGRDGKTLKTANCPTGF